MEFLSTLNESYTIETPFARAFQKHMTRHTSKTMSEKGSGVLFWAPRVQVLGRSIRGLGAEGYLEGRGFGHKLQKLCSICNSHTVILSWEAFNQP